LVEVCEKGSLVGKFVQDPVTSKSLKQIPPGVCGKPTEALIDINNISTTTLLDTGSTISTISRELYQQNLNNLPIQQVQSLLDIDCADGNSLPYDGFKETELQIPGVAEHFPALFLVIPDSTYNNSVPLLLERKILSIIIELLQKRMCERYLQQSNLTIDLYFTFRTMHLREKELLRNRCKLAIVRNACDKVIIPPNSNVTLIGYLGKKIPYHHTAVMLHTTDKSVIPEYLDIVPSLLEYRFMENKKIEVKISNITTRIVSVPERAVICEIQPVTIIQNSNQIYQKGNLQHMNQINIEQDNLSQAEIQQG
jgi:hypothetical protein